MNKLIAVGCILLGTTLTGWDAHPAMHGLGVGLILVSVAATFRLVYVALKM